MAQKTFADKDYVNTELAKKSDTGHTHKYAGSSSAGGAATSANKVNKDLAIKLNSGTTEGTNLFTFNGSAAKTVNITPANIGAAASSHTHTVLTMKSDNFKTNADLPSTYERGETLFFSNSPSSDKFNGLTYGLVQTLKEYSSGPAAWQFLYPYNSADDKFYVRNAQYNTDSWRSWAEVYTSLNKPTPADIGAAASSHGNHVPATQAAQNTTFLRNDNTWHKLTLSDLGAAAASHGTHVTYGTTNPLVAGTASPGSADTVSRSDHIHPAQTTVSGNAGSANKVNNNLVVKLNGGSTEGTNLFTFNGSAAKTINITPSAIGAAASSHGTHVTFSTTTPKANGTAAVGSESAVARGDHVHPLQTSVSGSSGSCTGNAATATKFASAQSVALTGDVTGSASSQAGWSVATTLANSGVTAGSYGPSANASPAHKGTFSVPYLTVDAKGRVTAASTKTITLPADSNTDTKVTNTVNTTTKYYVTGSSSASTNTGTQIFDTNVYVDATAGKFVATTMAVNNKVQMQYNADAESLDFIFI